MQRALDTYVGRPVIEILQMDESWYVELEGDVRVINRDVKNPIPDLPNGGRGFLFTNVIMDTKSTQMVVRDGGGNEYRIIFNPLDYQIYDPASEDQAWFPQAGGYRAFKRGDEPSLGPRSQAEADEIEEKKAELRKSATKIQKSSTKPTTKKGKKNG